MDYFSTFVCIVLLFTFSINCGVKGNVHGSTQPLLKFTMAELRALNTGLFVNIRPPDFDNFPNEMKKKKCRKGGVRRKNSRRGCRPILSTIVMGNVQSIAKKTDELSACLRLREFRNCSVMCFTETWLHSNIPDPVLDGFSFVRADRDIEITGKARRGGVCVYLNNDWCHPANVCVKEQVCTPHAEVCVLLQGLITSLANSPT